MIFDFYRLFFFSSVSYYYINPDKHQKYVIFLKELKEKFNKKQLLLTLSLHADTDDTMIIFQRFDYSSIVEHIDFIHVQIGRRNFPTLIDEFQTRNIHHLQNVIVKLLELNVPSTKILVTINFGGFKIQYPDGFSKHDLYYSSIQNSDYICSDLCFRSFSSSYNSEYGIK